MDYDLQVTVDGEVLLFSSLMVDETERVVAWTGYKNKTEWARACWNEEPAAQKAVYVICKARKDETVRFSDAKFRDDISCKYVDADGRHIVLKVQVDEEGAPILDKDGDPKPVMKNGRAVLLYADTGDEVFPTEAAEPPATSESPNTTGTPETSGSGTDSDSSTLLTVAS